jgi:hypothetical protein
MSLPAPDHDAAAEADELASLQADYPAVPDLARDRARPAPLRRSQPAPEREPAHRHHRRPGRTPRRSGQACMSQAFPVGPVPPEQREVLRQALAIRPTDSPSRWLLDTRRPAPRARPREPANSLPRIPYRISRFFSHMGSV